jgi:hypothetical protein
VQYPVDGSWEDEGLVFNPKQDEWSWLDADELKKATKVCKQHPKYKKPKRVRRKSVGRGSSRSPSPAPLPVARKHVGHAGASSRASRDSVFSQPNLLLALVLFLFLYWLYSSDEHLAELQGELAKVWGKITKEWGKLTKEL